MHVKSLLHCQYFAYVYPRRLSDRFPSYISTKVIGRGAASSNMDLVRVPFQSSWSLANTYDSIVFRPPFKPLHIIPKNATTNSSDRAETRIFQAEHFGPQHGEMSHSSHWEQYVPLPICSSPAACATDTAKNSAGFPLPVFRLTVLASPLDFKICATLLFDNQARSFVYLHSTEVSSSTLTFSVSSIPDLTRQDSNVKISLAHRCKIQDHFRPAALRLSGSGLGAS
ncbi:hypothetical protein DFH09DRAFT_1322667 [Mycena vulgaris]|nr:hypothetical protein DFH09DRAFT_1322667 [Mycena vulgaris]